MLRRCRFQCTTEQSKKLKIFVDISISEKAARGIQTQDLIDMFKTANKLGEDKKLVVAISHLS